MVRYLHATRTAAVLAIAAFASFAESACDLETLKGKFAGYYTFQESETYWGTQGALMVRFNGRGGLQIIKAVEAGEGYREVAGGSGNYKLLANCTGTASIDIKIDGAVVASGKIDLFISGSRASPRLHGIIVDQEEGTAGRLQLEKSSL
jgi:hypothetical protein